MTKIVGKKLRNYPEKTYSHAVTAVDIVLFRVHNNELQVLLLKLKEEPFEGSLALPGGLVTHKEPLEDSALRHLKNKMGIEKPVYMEQLYTFGNPERDPLGWVVSVAYLGLVSEDLNLKIAPRYAGYEWLSVKHIPDLAYDHEDIVAMAVKRLQSKMSYTNIVQFLIGKEFTLTELQQIYELVTEKELDKRNFRKKILALKIIKPLKAMRKDGPQRPARLYSFTSDELLEAPIL